MSKTGNRHDVDGRVLQDEDAVQLKLTGSPLRNEVELKRIVNVTLLATRHPIISGTI